MSQVSPAGSDSPDEFLRRLRRIGVEVFPYAEHGAEEADVLDPLYAALAHSLADFVDAWRVNSPSGYWGAVTIAHRMIHDFPAPPTKAQMDEANEFVSALDRWPTAVEVEYPPKAPA